MANLQSPHARFGLVWSEGALYSTGLRNAFHIWYDLLGPGGYLAFTDSIWRKADPPPAVNAMFEQEYPAMGWLADDLARSQACRFV